MKKKILLFTDGFPYDPGEKPFLYHELCVLSKTNDVDIVASVRKKYADNSVNIDLPQNVKIFKYCIADVGKKEQIKFLPQILVSRAWIKEKSAVKNAGGNRTILNDAYIYIMRAYMFLKWLTSEVELTKYDVCYTYWNSYATLALALYKQEHDVFKLITRTHGYDLYNERMTYKRQYYKKYVDGYLDKVVFIAESGKEYYCDHFIDDKTDVNNKYIVSPIGVTLAERIPEKTTDNFVIVSCSSVIPLKRVDIIASALAQITDRHIHWIHLGGGSEFDKLSNLCKQLFEQNESVTYELKGQISNEQVREFYCREFVDCFITTSSTEGSPVSIQEALAYGIPIIGTRVGEIPQLIEECGLLISENPSIDEVKNAVLRMIDLDKNEVKIIRDRALAKMKETYDADKNAYAFSMVLNNL